MNFKLACRFIRDMPLEVLADKKEKVGRKIGFGIVAALFTIFTLGGYGVYAAHYFKNRKVVKLCDHFQEAVRKGDLEKAKTLLNKHPLLRKNITETLLIKKTSYPKPIYAAIQGGQLEMVKLLHQKGADLNWMPPGRSQRVRPALFNDEQELTPLEFAVLKNHLDIVKYLVDEGKVKLTPSAFLLTIDPNISKASWPIMHFLLEKGCEVGDPSFLFMSWAYEKQPNEEAQEVIKLLLKQGVRPSEAEYKEMHPDLKQVVDQVPPST